MGSEQEQVITRGITSNCDIVVSQVSKIVLSQVIVSNK